MLRSVKFAAIIVVLVALSSITYTSFLIVGDNNNNNNRLGVSNYSASQIHGYNKHECRSHIIFTTFKETNGKSNLRQQIENNTRHVWSSMAGQGITFKVVNTTSLPVNKYGTPILGGLYTKMFKECPFAQTYTYINGDIIGNIGFVDTLNAASLMDGDFLIVGRRTNVRWKDLDDTYDASHKDFNLTSHLNNGTLFVAIAQDYFSVTKNAIDWNFIPFVIGYDNWLVEYAYFEDNVSLSLIDATDSAPVIHQTDEKGDYSWGGGGLEQGDISYNLDLIKKSGRSGKYKVTGHLGDVWRCPWESVRDEDGKNILVRCRESYASGEYGCNKTKGVSYPISIQ